MGSVALRSTKVEDPMSAVNITTQALLAAAGVTALVGQRINPGPFPQSETYPAIAVHLVSEPDEYLLQGAAQYFESRVSIECGGTTFGSVDTLGEAVKTALSDIHLGAYAGKTATFYKEATDATDYSDETEIYRRILDYQIRWR